MSDHMAPRENGPFAYDVFVCYSESDRKWVAGHLLPRLQGAGLRVVIDFLNYEIGVPILENIENAILKSRHTVVVITKAWLGSRWGNLQGVLVMHADLTTGARRLLPLLLEKCELPLHLAQLYSADFTDPDAAADQWGRVLAALGQRQPGNGPVGGDTVTRALVRLSDLLSDPRVREQIIASRETFRAVSEQISVLADHKDLHDWLHEIQVRCYNPTVALEKWFPQEPALSFVKECDRDLERFLDRLRQVAERPSFREKDVLWIRKLDEAHQRLNEAHTHSSRQHLSAALALLRRVISTEPPRISIRLNTLAGNLRLGKLAEEMKAICDRLDVPDLRVDRIDLFRAGTADLKVRNSSLRALVGEHETWQQVDDSLRRVEAQLGEDDLDELEQSWEDLQSLTEALCRGGASPELQRFQADGAKLDAALKAKTNPADVLQAFRSYRGRATQLFYEVDKALKRECDELRTVGQSLNAVLEALST